MYVSMCMFMQIQQFYIMGMVSLKPYNNIVVATMAELAAGGLWTSLVSVS